MSRLFLGCLFSVALACAEILTLSASTGARALPPVQVQAIAPSVAEVLALPASGMEAATVYEAATVADSSKTAPQVLRWSAAHLGGDRVFFQLDFDREYPVTGAKTIVYLDVDNDSATGRQDTTHKGVDLMLAIADNALSLYPKNPQLNARNTTGRARQEGESIYLVMDVPLIGEAAAKAGPITFSGYITCTEAGKRSSKAVAPAISLANAGAVQPPALPQTEGNLLNSAGYRYIGDRVAYESLANKGMRAEEIVRQGYTPARPAPLPQLRNSGPQQRPPAVAEVEVIPVSVTEEAGVARKDAVVRFGFPLPKGTLFQPDQLSVSDVAGNPLPAEAQVTALWPDGSLRWVALQLRDAFAAGETKHYSVAVGRSEAKAADTEPASGEQASPVPIRIKQTDAAIAIDTGKVQAVIALEGYRGLASVHLAGETKAFAVADGGFVIRSEDGTEFSTAGLRPSEVTFEEQTPGRITLRIAGEYATAAGERGMSYVSRLTFYAGSGQVDLAHTTINTLLQREFTDFQSLGYALRLTAPLTASQVLTAAATPAVAGSGDGAAADGAARFTAADTGADGLRLRQWTDRQAEVLAAGEAIAAQRLPGALSLTTAEGSMALAVTDFWQRWPKGISFEGNTLSLEFLPPLPSADFGKDLPYYLQFPFVDGFYRLKWGMAFTERVVFDFSAPAEAAVAAAEAWAQAQLPLVAILPSSWYARTGALVPLAEARAEQFSLWDDYISNSFEAHLKLKDRAREYGFLNYGDWFGERGRNWGNNEYDLPHTLFSQFARTGQTRYYRLAQNGVRHQADVDIIHAYPDPYYVGANHQHSIGHTGQWSQHPANATWSYAYDGHTSAGNGHTWADGMADAWALTADPVVMEAALKLGDHISFAFAPGFTKLGTHERSAGWSMRALMALYRSTGDPLYLEAAGRIGETALSSQDKEKTGVWPHELPVAHAQGRTGIRGNNVFLIGVLLNGLYAYHEETADERYAEAIDRAAQWLSANWNEAAAAWPYSATEDNEPLGRVSPGLNPLIFGGLLYGGLLRDDPRMIAQAEAALATTFAGITEDSRGKDVSLRGFFTPETLGRLQRYHDAKATPQAEVLLSNTPAFRESYLARQPLAEDFFVRSPDAKAFVIDSDGAGVVKAVRTLFGQGPVRFPQGTIRLIDSAGNAVFEDTFDTGGAAIFEIPLPSKGRWRLLVEDNQRSSWSVDSPQAQVRSELLPGYRIGGVGTKRLQFEVPEGTEAFEVEVVGVHRGSYGVAVINPDGRLKGDYSGINEAGNLLEPGMDVYLPQYASAVHRMAVKLDKSDRSGTWDLVLWAGGDIGVQLKGVPNYLFIGKGD